jgi:hypothetical protein
MSPIGTPLLGEIGTYRQQFRNEGCSGLPSHPSGQIVLKTRAASSTENSDRLHIENDTIFLLNVAARISGQR